MQRVECCALVEQLEDLARLRVGVRVRLRLRGLGLGFGFGLGGGLGSAFERRAHA